MTINSPRYRVKRAVHRDKKSSAARFWAKVEQGGAGCWIPMGGKNERGAGLFADDTSPKHMVQAHRYAFQLFYGPIPEGMHGHTPGYRSKLTIEQVREIRRQWRDWPSWAALGRHYKVHEKTVRSAALGVTWRNVA